MNIKTKLTLSIAMLVSMIVLLVIISVINLETLTATEPDSPYAASGLERALWWIYIAGGICIAISVVLLLKLPGSINKPIGELKNGILEIANHHYDRRLHFEENEEFKEVAESFNRMAEKLTEYRASTLSDILSGKKYIEGIVNSITEPIIGLNNEKEILFINDEALNILNLKRENVIRQSAPELSLKNDLLRRLIRELVTPENKEEKKEPLKIYADNKESYFQAQYIPIRSIETGEKETKEISELDILRTAIWNHSAYRVEEGLTDRVKIFCNIIRDADKIDILKVNYDVTLEVIYDVTTEELKNSGVTDEVMKAFMEHHAVLRSLKKTPIDNLVGHAALVFELVYNESFKIVKEQGYIEKMLSYVSDNQDTVKKFEIMRNDMNKFLAEHE